MKNKKNQQKIFFPKFSDQIKSEIQTLSKVLRPKKSELRELDKEEEIQVKIKKIF